MRKNVLGIIAVATAAAGAAVAAKFIKDKVSDKEEFDDTDVNFINIDEEDDVVEEEEGEEESDEEEPCGEVDVISEICELYPYLNASFVQELLDRSNEYNVMFEEDTLVTVKHGAAFTHHDDLEEFLDIMESAGYTCVQTEENELFAYKKLVTENGALVSEILNVANQVAALNGTYKGQTAEG